MGKGSRYERDAKLNLKKVFAVLIAFAVIIMFIIMVNNLAKEAENEKNITPVNYYALYANDCWGVLDSNGDMVIEPMYKEMIIVLNKQNDVFLCNYDVNMQTGEYKTKAINKDNKEIFTEYDNIEALVNFDSNGNVWYESNLLKIQKDGKYGVIDINGKQILSAQYDNIEALKGVKNSLLIEKNGEFGLANNNGNIIINTSFKVIESVDEDYKHGYIVIDSEDKKGLISFTGNQVLETKYNDILKSYNENYFAVKQDGKQILIDIEGNTILLDGYDSISQVNNDGIVFTKGKKYGFMDLDGQIKVNAQYEDLEEINFGILRAKKQDKYGLIDLSDNEKIEFKYVDISYYDKIGLYIAEDETFNSDIMNSEFDVKLTGLVSEINIDDGYMNVRIGEESKYFNFKFEEKDIKDIFKDNNLFVSSKNGKYGFVDREGNLVVDYIYNEALEQNKNGFAAVKLNGLWGAIDRKGKVVVAPKYNLEKNLVIDFIGKWHLGQDLNMNYYCEK